MVKVSIVVPVYNVEKYLAQCLNSLCKQTMKEIEIICVDDGSKDSSPNIIKKFQQKDRRVRCVSKQNSGYGNTMNMGMDAAEGEYLSLIHILRDSQARYRRDGYNESSSHSLVKIQFFGQKRPR